MSDSEHLLIRLALFILISIELLVLLIFMIHLNYIIGFISIFIILLIGIYN
jgi:hypothetical protein